MCVRHEWFDMQKHCQWRIQMWDQTKQEQRKCKVGKQFSLTKALSRNTILKSELWGWFQNCNHVHAGRRQLITSKGYVDTRTGTVIHKGLEENQKGAENKKGGEEAGRPILFTSRTGKEEAMDPSTACWFGARSSRCITTRSNFSPKALKNLHVWRTDFGKGKMLKI